MNKQEFMQLLEQRIKLLPLSERHRLINFYNEALEDRIEEGMSEEDAVASLDGLDELSLNLYDEIKEEPIEKDKRTNIIPCAVKWFLIVLASPIWLMIPVILLILLLVWGLLLVILLVFGLCFLIMAVCGFFLMPSVYSANFTSFVVLVGTVLLSIGLAPWCWFGFKAWTPTFVNCCKSMPGWCLSQWQKAVKA